MILIYFVYYDYVKPTYPDEKYRTTIGRNKLSCQVHNLNFNNTFKIHSAEWKRKEKQKKQLHI